MNRLPPPSRRQVLSAAGLGVAAVAAVAGAGGAAGATLADRSRHPVVPALGTVLLAGTGIDPTGELDSVVAVQQMLDSCADGTTVVVPSGAVLRLEAGIVIRRRITLTGAGELRFAPGRTSTAAPLISIEAEGVWLDGVHLTNPEGIQTYGVLARASAFRATGCLLRGFQDGLMVAATGEFHDIVITDNLILDIIGSGRGPGSASSDGESNGDGIVVWGAAAVITGNRVTCKNGCDARIGIHVEALPDRAVDRTGTVDSLIAISGNTVTGRFRRGIVTEGVAHTAITGNVVADPTWWGIAVIGTAHGSTLVGNTIRWTRQATDDAGSAWSPHRAGIMLFCIQEPLRDVVLSANVVEAAADSAMEAGVYLQADATLAAPAATRVTIIGSVIDDLSGGMDAGIDLAAPTAGVRVADVQITGFRTHGVRATGAERIAIQQNDIVGPGSSTDATGVTLDGGASSCRITDNGISDVRVGVQANDRRSATIISGNALERAQVGVDVTGSGDTVLIDGNALHGVVSAVIGRPTSRRTKGSS